MNQKLILPVIGGVLLCAIAFQFFSPNDDHEVAAVDAAKPIAQSFDEIPLPQPTTQTAPVVLPAQDEAAEEPVGAVSYEDRLFAAGWNNENSELYNTSASALRGYVEQYFAGNFPDREFVGNAAWQMTIRTAVHMYGEKKTLDLPAYITTAKYAVLSAALLNDSAPIRHLVTGQMNYVGEEESALALAEWAVDRFEDSSTPALYEFIDSRYRSVERQGRDLDSDGVGRVKDMFDRYTSVVQPWMPEHEQGADNG